VPDFDARGARVGFKKDEAGQVVVSRVHPETLEAIARGTGGRMFVLTAADLTLAPLAATLEGIEQRTLAREFSYKKKERFQLPLGIGLLALLLAHLLPLPVRLRRRPRAAAAAALLLLAWASPARAQSKVADEVLLRPTRRTAEGRKLYSEGNDPKALEAFNKAAASRPGDPRTRFNVADSLYKSGRLDEARTTFEQLAADPRSPLAAPARFNLGNTLYQKQDYAGAVRAYRDALRLTPNDLDTRRNLELALRALQQEQQKKEKQDQDQKDKEKQQGGGGGQKQSPQQQGQGNQGAQGQQGQKQERPKTEEEKERERYEKETGMPKERAMQLLNALQQNEKSEQKKLQADRRKVVPRTKDW
jgi:tetratricopeptide (TPR) repeat protein